MDGPKHDLVVPCRPDGSPRAFFYDREGGHVIHRLRDGSLVAIGWDCRHEVEVDEVRE